MTTYRFTVQFDGGRTIVRTNQDLEDWEVFLSKSINYSGRKDKDILDMFYEEE